MTDRNGYDAPRKPCAECPWRKDVSPGKFEPDRFRDLAGTSYDMAERIFACHKSADDRPTICAGFLARGASHNLTIRLAYARGQLEMLDRSGNLALYPDYRSMAIANGVDCDDVALDACRAGQAEEMFLEADPWPDPQP